MAATSSGKNKFFSRLLKFKHMEFDSALQQLAWALVSPKKLYRNHEANYKTKGSWSRDDPAFLLCICAFLVLSAVGFSLILRLGVVGSFLTLLYIIGMDFLLSGLVVATLLWFISNKFLMKKSGREKAPVEWMYCFDIHINSYVPLAVLVFGLQMPLIGVLQSKMAVWTIVSIIIWTCALCSYIYSTFLGYSVVSQLENTVVLLSPVLPLLAMGVVSIPLHWNYSIWFAEYYRFRVGQ
jgi:hypothetical protein